MPATTFGCWWPMFTFTSWLEKSRYFVPAASQTVLPRPPAITIGARFAWADQEWKTCARSSSSVRRPSSGSDAVPAPSAEVARVMCGSSYREESAAGRMLPAAPEGVLVAALLEGDGHGREVLADHILALILQLR